MDAGGSASYVSIMAHAANRLAAEPSLYLRQHGHNPVDWYPWGPEALERARREQRPILLSIGYSACHWCHVMERESFEDEEIARLMNESFVCIKVDREERPDLDNVYMKTVQMMTGRGGWPMTVFLTPDLRPFYGGTYFPPSDRGGMPGFPRVLAALARVFREEPQKVADSGTRVLEALEREAAADNAETPSAPTITESAAALTRAIDREYGGFGGAPKFPGSLGLAFLMGVQRHSPDSDRAALLRTTLDKMADGGIYDHVGGGFHRYSVDRFWLVPHFEKMLYDQALLAETYGEAWQLFGEPRYAETAGEVLDYVAREMTSPQGAFFATQDADSEGEEGKFYLWTPAEVRDVVGAEAAEIVCRFYDVSDEGNFEGRNILHRTISIADAARMFDITPDRVQTIVANARRALYERRKARVAPATDTKILTDWNGLMIASMASVAARLERPGLVDCAARAADVVRTRMMPQGRLKHFFAQGEARVDAFLDDFAFFGRASLELFAALGRREDFECACACADALIARFEDPRGGFFFTAADSEQVLVRSRDIFDGAVPSGNAVATELLLRLYELTGRDDYRRAGEASLDSLLARAALNPYGSASLLTVADRHARGYADVVVAVDPADRDRARRLRSSALRTHAPEVSVFSVENPGDPWLPAALRGKSPITGRSSAYVCRKQACGPPTSQPDELEATLAQSSA